MANDSGTTNTTPFGGSASDDADVPIAPHAPLPADVPPATAAGGDIEAGLLRAELLRLEGQMDRLDTDRVHVMSRREVLISEVERLKREHNEVQGLLTPVLDKEKDIESRIASIDEREHTAVTADERRQAEEERWRVEEMRRAIEEEKWRISEGYDRRTAAITEKESERIECDRELASIDRNYAALKENRDAKLTAIEMMAARKERELLAAQLVSYDAELVRATQTLKDREKLERDAEREYEAIAVRERSEKSLDAVRDIERERWALEIRRKSAEEGRWSAEQEVARITVARDLVRSRLVEIESKHGNESDSTVRTSSDDAPGDAPHESEQGV